MDRPPRRRDRGILDRPMLVRAWGWLGLVEAALVTAGFLWVLQRGGWSAGAETGEGSALHGVWLTATTYRQKYRNWQHQPATALSITDPDDQSRYLEVRGVVERIIPDPEGAEFVRLAERYGEPQGPPADKAYRIAVAIRPRRTTSQ